MLRGRRYHLIGIGGVGMSGLARLLSALGARVSGCDLKKTATTEALKAEGVEVFYGHDPGHLRGAEVVVYSSAVKPDHPELVRARDLGLPLLPRAEMLSEIMALHPKSIAVAGSHGKTTTASMIAEVLTRAGLQPTVAIGGRVNNFGVNARLGQGPYLVAETDESDGSFLMLKPYIGVVTNIDREHLDFYADFKAVKKAFVRFCRRVDSEGGLVLCGDDPGVKSILPELSGDLMTYGFSEGVDLFGEVISGGPYPETRVAYKGRILGKFRLSVPGKHNALNALAAVGVGLKLGLSPEVIFSGLRSFSGVGRRLEKKGRVWGVEIFDDYAHHPAELEVSLKALRDLFPGRRLLVVFQPHRYTRTRALWRDFLRVLEEPDVLFLTEIYPASETPIPGISGESFFQAVRRVRKDKPTLFSSQFEGTVAQVEFFLSGKEVLVTMGAGDVYRVSEELLKAQTLKRVA